MGLIAALVPDLAHTQAVPRGETARGTTVATRPRADFDPLGVRLDGWRLDASAELGLGYDDNLFGTERGTRSDGYVSDLFEARAQTDWSRHALGATGTLEERRYLRTTSQDWRDYAVGLFGRYDVNADTNLEARYNHVQAHLDVSNVDVQRANLSRPVPYQYDEGQLQGTTTLNRLGLTALGTYRAYRFENVDFGPVPAGSADPGRVSRFDFDTWLGALGASYALAPGRFVNLIGRVQDIRYRDSAQSGRDSFTWEVLAGFTYDFDGIWAARVALGYRERSYEGSFETLSGPAFEGEVTWQPTLLTTVGLTARRSIEESIRGNAVSFTRSQGALRVDHEYLRNVILGAELGLDRREYDQPDEQATDGFAVLSARWLINRNLALVGSYQHARRLDATRGVQEYDRNLFQLRLRVAL